MSHLFGTITDALGLNEAYETARNHYTDSAKLERFIMGGGLLDDGNVIDSSLANPMKFMGVTDALYDYLNDNLDKLPMGATVLEALKHVEIISADSFIPTLRTAPNATNPGHVDVSCTGIGLCLSLFRSEVVDSTFESMDDILDNDESNESRVVPSGRLTIHDNDTIEWTPYAEVSTGVSVDEPEIPGDVRTFDDSPVEAHME